MKSRLLACLPKTPKKTAKPGSLPYARLVCLPTQTHAALLRPAPPRPAMPQSPARRVHPGWLSDNSIYLSPARSAQIQRALLKLGVLNADGMVKYDVRLVS